MTTVTALLNSNISWAGVTVAVAYMIHRVVLALIDERKTVRIEKIKAGAEK